MEDFQQHFDVYDDFNDLLDLETDELNRYFLEGHLQTMTNEEDEMMEVDSLNNSNDLEVNIFL